MELFNSVERWRKLNTKGCCFLCLKNEEINKTKDLEGNHVLNSASIRYLLRHLQIPTGQSTNGTVIVGEHFKQEDIQMDLCENCGEMINRFSVLFQNLEKIQLEMDYVLERIHKSIAKSAKDPELVQNYSKRMTSDLEALSQLVLVNNLRKEVSEKCLKELHSPRLRVILTRENYKGLKRENTDTSYGSEEADIERNINSTGEICLPDFTSSPPPSPISTEDNGEEMKCSKSLALTENDKLSPKPPVKRKTKRGKYYTRVRVGKGSRSKVKIYLQSLWEKVCKV